MSVGSEQIRKLLEKLVAASPAARDTAADAVTDWVRSYDLREAAIISKLLIWLASAETDDSAKEAQLNALAELATHNLVPSDVLAEVGRLSRAELRGSSIEHFDYLQSARTAKQ